MKTKEIFKATEDDALKVMFNAWLRLKELE